MVIQDRRHSRAIHCGTRCYVSFSARSFLCHTDICMFSVWMKDMFWTQNPRAGPGLNFL